MPARSSELIRQPIDPVNLWDPYGNRIIKPEEKKSKTLEKAPEKSSAETLEEKALADKVSKRRAKNVLESDPYTPNFRMPTFWRRFIFNVLNPREFVTYCSVIAHCNSFGTALLSPKRLMIYANLADERQVKKSLETLTSAGFLLSKKDKNKKSNLILQRPSIHHTIRVLLETNKISSAFLALEVGKVADFDFNNADARKALTAVLLALFGKSFTKDYMKDPTAHNEEKRVGFLIDKIYADEMQYRKLIERSNLAKNKKRAENASARLEPYGKPIESDDDQTP